MNPDTLWNIATDYLRSIGENPADYNNLTFYRDGRIAIWGCFYDGTHEATVYYVNYPTDTARTVVIGKEKPYGN